jgi:hypothetical protein
VNDDIHTPLASGIVLPDATTVRSVGIARLLVVTLAARALCRASPATIRAILSRLAAGTQPATYPEAESAVLAVSQFSKTAAGHYGCLQRSVGACLLLRLDRKWPHWCVGVPTKPPFRAHAWIEADGHIVADLGALHSYSRLISVPAGRWNS